MQPLKANGILSKLIIKKNMSQYHMIKIFIMGRPVH